MKVKVKRIIRAPKRVEVTLIKAPRLVIKAVDPTDDILSSETADELAADYEEISVDAAEADCEIEQDYEELYDEVEDMFDDALTDAMEDAARFSDIDDEDAADEEIADDVTDCEDSEIDDTNIPEDAEISEDEEPVDNCAEDDISDDVDVSEDDESEEAAFFDVDDSITSLDTDGDGETDTGVFCRYFDRDNQGEMVEVSQSNASGREYVYIDENSGKLSRICGIIKNETDSDEDSIF